VRYAFIRAHRAVFRICAMCRVLRVSKAGFYEWQSRAPSSRAQRDAEIAVEIKAFYRESGKRYGSPRIHADLQDAGTGCGRKRVARIMREHGVVGKSRKRRRPRTTDSKHKLPIAPNLLNRQFSPEEIKQTNRTWAGDITYIPTNVGWLYLAVVLDLRSRRVVGWSMRCTMEADLVLDALRMALLHRQPSPGVLYHSDRGSQYASKDARKLLREHGMKCSMSRKGNCWDNAVVESFFGSLKNELVDDANFKTRDEARQAIFEWIEIWYNRKRRHSTLGYVSPAAYELSDAA